MDLLKDYSSDGSISDIGNSVASENSNNDIKVDAAPEVNITALVEKETDQKNQQFALCLKDDPNLGMIKHTSGVLEKHAMNSTTFHEQYHNFIKYGVVIDPTKGGSDYIVKRQTGEHYLDFWTEKANPNDEIVLTKSIYNSNAQAKATKKYLKSTRLPAGKIEDGSWLGPWAPYETDQENVNNMMTDEQKEILTKIEEKRKKKKQEEEEEDQKPTTSSTQHIQESKDYLGRSYILPPPDMKHRPDITCYIPKKHMHTYTGHKKGVQCIRFFPQYGHFLLSGSFDTTIKLWDVYKNKACVRTYLGHKEMVKDQSFTNDGLHFLSASYDSKLIYWDTETGQSIQTFDLKKHPYCIKFHPDSDRQHSFLCGSAHKKVTQYDVRSGSKTQTYDEHLGPVNSIVFVDNNKKFASTSDDKKIFLWEFGIPVVVKHVSDPEQLAISQTALHPNGKYFVGQASDNKINTYDAKAGSLRLNKKKKFVGHMSAGYAIGLTFSVDGQFVASGDHDGRVFFFDWKTTKCFSCLNAHNKVCIGVDWHPNENSTVATCSWDGTIKLWSA